MTEFITVMLSPCAFLFMMGTLGLLVGRVRIGAGSLGTVGVLVTSILGGYITELLIDETFAKTKMDLLDNCAIMSSIGTALFVAAIGITAGQRIVRGDGVMQLKAFLSGIIVVSIGGIITTVLAFPLRSLPKEIILGVFSGGMTNSPTLALMSELMQESSLITIGYGATYCFGLMFTVIFVHLPDKLLGRSVPNPAKGSFSENPVTTESLPVIIVIAFLGTLLGKTLSIGISGGSLLCGITLGFILMKRGVMLSSMSEFRSLGLILFFVGNGVPAGMKMTGGVDWRVIFLGILIPLLSIGLGALVIRAFLKIRGNDLRTVVCGGMTSSPSFEVLQKRDGTADSTLYAVSYAGALLALFQWTRILICLL